MFDILIRQLRCLPPDFDTPIFDQSLPTNRSELEHLSPDAAGKLDAAISNGYTTQPPAIIDCMHKASGIPLD